MLLLFLPLSVLLTSPVGTFVVWLQKSEAEVDTVWFSRHRETQSAVSFIFVPVCAKLAADLSLNVSYSVPWSMARILNETGFRAVLNYAAWTAQCHALALKVGRGD